MELSKLPWWVGLPASLGFGLMGVFAPTFLPNWAQAALFAVGALCVLWSVGAGLWHFAKGRRSNALEQRPQGSSRDVSLSEGVAYIQSGNWGEDIQTLFNDTPNDYARIAEELVQRAADEKITVWGRPERGSPLERVPSSHWRDYALDSLAVGCGIPRTQTRRFDRANEGIYSDLMVSKHEFESEWPNA